MTDQVFEDQPQCQLLFGFRANPGCVFFLNGSLYVVVEASPDKGFLYAMTVGSTPERVVERFTASALRYASEPANYSVFVGDLIERTPFNDLTDAVAVRGDPEALNLVAPRHSVWAAVPSSVNLPDVRLEYIKGYTAVVSKPRFLWLREEFEIQVTALLLSYVRIQ